jgi:murein DD-endopeptidase MepM/ murein hydrolase activator NlpD
MLKFIRILFRKRNRRIKILVLDDLEPEADDSYSLIPNSLFFGLVASVMFLVSITAVLFIFTPLGMFLYNTEDAELRGQVISMGDRLVAIQDSLDRREEQYKEIIRVLREGADTTFSSDAVFQGSTRISEDGMVLSNTTFDDAYFLSQNDIIYSEILKTAPSFPASFPVRGILTRDFDSAEKHFGIDIASKEGSDFNAVADGTVISAGWTINNGYSIYIQHAGGMVSVYKHASRLYRQIGELVQKGENLGVVGNTGLLSSGPHLHFELWKDGVALDPADYLIQ